MDFQDVKQGDVGWIDLADDSDRWKMIANAVMALSGSIKCC